MSEINNNNIIGPFNKEPIGYNAGKNKPCPQVEQEKECPCCENKFDIADEAKEALGRAQIHAPKNINETTEMNDHVQAYIEYFLNNPELCQFAVDIMDVYIDAGMSTEDSFIETAKIISSMQDELAKANTDN